MTSIRLARRLAHPAFCSLLAAEAQPAYLGLPAFNLAARKA
jgi:hypothetical protein